MRKQTRFYAVKALAGALVLLSFFAAADELPAVGDIPEPVSVVKGRSALDYPSVWECDSQKFSWYCDEQPAKPVPQQEAQPKKDEKPKEIVEFEKMQEKLETLKKISIMNPTKENVRSYIAYQEEVMQKSSVFADTWRRVIWETPELDYSLKGRPTNTLALQTYDAKRGKDKQTTLRSLAQTHGMFFFFRSDCPYCHAFAPIVKRFEQRYGIKVFPVSLDGIGLPEYPRPTADNGIASTLSVSSVPALFLAVPGSKQITPLGYGVMSDTEIEERIFTMTQTEPGQNF